MLSRACVFVAAEAAVSGTLAAIAQGVGCLVHTLQSNTESGEQHFLLPFQNQALPT